MIERLKAGDLLAKIAAIVLALVVWSQVVNDKNPMKTRDLSLALELNVPEGRVVMSTSVDRVTVTLEGRATMLDALNPERISIPVDLSEVGLGEQTVSIDYEPPNGVGLVGINPKTVVVDTDVIETRTVSVSVQPRGTPHDDYEVGKPVASQETVKVTGPKRQVDRVQWAVGEIDVTGAMGEVKAVVSLTPRDSLSNTPSKVTVEPEEVDVVVPLVPRPPAKTVPVQVEVTGELKAGYRLEAKSPQPQFVRIRAPENILRNINSLSTRPIDINGKDTSFTQTANLIVPSGIAWIETTQVSVRLDIVEDVLEKKFTNVIVTPKDPMPNLTWDVSPPQVDVVLRGRRDIISKLKATDIEAYVDARDREPGQHQLRVFLVLPQNTEINIVDIMPGQVTLYLKRR